MLLLPKFPKENSIIIIIIIIKWGFCLVRKKKVFSTPSNPQLSSTLHTSRVCELGRHAGEPRSILKFARKSCQTSPSLAEARLVRFLLPMLATWHVAWRCSDQCCFRQSYNLALQWREGRHRVRHDLPLTSQTSGSETDWSGPPSCPARSNTRLSRLNTHEYTSSLSRLVSVGVRSLVSSVNSRLLRTVAFISSPDPAPADALQKFACTTSFRSIFYRLFQPMPLESCLEFRGVKPDRERDIRIFLTSVAQTCTGKDKQWVR